MKRHQIGGFILDFGLLAVLIGAICWTALAVLETVQ
jgi:hypothetical protein